MKQEANMEHSAEWLRGAYRIASRYAPMDVVMQINVQLSAAEAREAGEKRGQPCTCLSHQFVECRGAERLGKGWVCQRQQDADAAQPSAAEVIRVAKAALEDIRAAVTTSTGQCGVMGTNWAECDYCGAVSRERMTPIPHEKGCAVSRSTEALATISAWEAGNA